MIDAGIYSDIPSAEYHADKFRDVPTLSRSGIVTLLSGTPADYAAQNPRLRNPEWPALDDSTDAKDLGTILHQMVLGDFARFIVGDPSEHGFVKSGPNKGQPYTTWTGDAAEWKREQQANGFIVIDRDTHDEALRIAAKLSDAIVARFGTSQWDRRRVEQTILWARRLNDGSEIWCKARPDCILPDGTIIDLKTTALPIDDVSLGKRMAAEGADIQCEWYRSGALEIELMNAADIHTPPERPPFVFAYARTVAPFSTCFVNLDELPDWNLGVTRMRIDKAAHIFGECARTGVWPDRPLDASPVPPSWWISATEKQAGLDGEIEAES